MTSKYISLPIGFLLLVLSFQANAGKLFFGSQDMIQFTANTTMTRDGKQLYLARRITLKAFLLPYSVQDNGYVLGITGESKKYIPLPEGAVLESIQANGLLPNPLPPYKFGWFEYLVGYALWWFLLIVVGFPIIKMKILKRRNGSSRGSMKDAERFLRLSEVCKGLVQTASHNLSVLKSQHGKEITANSTLAQMRPFNLAKLGMHLKEIKGNSSYSLILGDFNERMAFYPSITEKILKINSVANFVNAALQTQKVSSAIELAQPLQHTLLDFHFLGKTFLYLAQKAKLIDGKAENIVTKKAELESLLKSYHQWFISGLDELVKPCLDGAHVNEKLGQYAFKPYSWMEMDAGNEGKMVNDYFLPKDYWEPYLKQMAVEQAKAMAH